MDGESESFPNYRIIVLPALNQYYGIDIQNTQILHVEIAITKYYHETDIFQKFQWYNRLGYKTKLDE